MKRINYILLRGGVVSIYASKMLTTLVLATDGGGKETSFPTIAFYDGFPRNIKAGDRVTIEAHVQTRRSKSTTGKNTYFQDYVGDSISKTKRILADYIDDAKIPPYDGGCQKDVKCYNKVVTGVADKIYYFHTKE